MIFRKNIQQSWLMRCASPSTPASFRISSWMDLTVVRTDKLEPRQQATDSVAHLPERVVYARWVERCPRHRREVPAIEPESARFEPEFGDQPKSEVDFVCWIKVLLFGSVQV